MGKKRYNTTNYNYGSTAPDIYREVQRPQRPNTQKRQKRQEKRQEENMHHFKRRLNLVFSIATVFVASAVFVWGCAVVSHKQYELEQANSEVQELRSQVNNAKSVIASSTNLDHIKERAINELNMREPLTHQIVLLDIVKTSYTVLD